MRQKEKTIAEINELTNRKFSKTTSKVNQEIAQLGSEKENLIFITFLEKEFEVKNLSEREQIVNQNKQTDERFSTLEDNLMLLMKKLGRLERKVEDSKSSISKSGAQTYKHDSMGKYRSSQSLIKLRSQKRSDRFKRLMQPDSGPEETITNKL